MGMEREGGRGREREGEGDIEGERMGYGGGDGEREGVRSILLCVPGRKGARDLAGRPLMSRYSADSRAIPCDRVSLRVIARLQWSTQTSVIA